ncbi:urease accessory protein UreF [Siccirubricoccus sp. KC 17139]|uniref:Urease accessory protein UreF n=1 Tax=Siccirubricoccus soli TaxID=2899147 RepID=A0ABT1DBR3_9PROT|nr:urease accessory protein UreF [Siccirubricoccus soli]MCO6419376.1 urease accessory protein UreF [Siccirubricoccus soli]MCP2685511.1 urease accessory protein UreF [Siccirubricoccus soli]
MASTTASPAITTTTTTAMTTTTTEGAPLYRLLAWLSPAYPIGAYTYSHGLERAVEDGAVRTRAELLAYVATVLRDGAGRVDAALLVAAWRAAASGDDAALDAAARLAAAWRGTAETALETMAQGTAFTSVTLAAWPEPRLAAFAARHPRALAHPVAFGAAAGCHGIPLRPALTGFLSGFAANLVSAGVRLVPLGQTDGQIATAALHPVVEAAADAAEAAGLDSLGTAAPMLDLLSMRHETQYTRLFRS